MSGLAEGARQEPAAPSLSDLAGLLRGVVFVGAFALAWITLHPFESLGKANLLDVQSGNEALTYLAFALLAALAGILLTARWRYLLACVQPRPAQAMLLWLCLTSLVSSDPSISIKRLAFVLIIMALTACLFLLPRDQRELARFLAVATGLLLVLSLAGVIFVPELAVHQASDVQEPQLAGDWRGVFGHKNEAAAVFSSCVFIGLFIARSGLPIAGSLIALGSCLFVLASGGKSSTLLLFLAFGIGMVWEWSRNKALRVLIALAPLLLLLTLGVGSVLFPPLGELSAKLPLDTTFTGRTDVWRYAADNLPGHYTTGHGFQAFWGTAERLYGSGDAGWAGTAAHAHNGYLDLVVETGLPGLMLAMLFLLVGPLRDVFAASNLNVNPTLLTMLTQIWLFGLYLSTLESFFFSRAHPAWVVFIFAVFGLRFAASFRLKGID